MSSCLGILPGETGRMGVEKTVGKSTKAFSSRSQASRPTTPQSSLLFSF